MASAALTTCLLGAEPATASPDFSQVPGTVVSYEPSPNPLRHLFDQVFKRGSFISSPTLAVLPNGHYVAGHDLFRNGGKESPEGRGTTKVFRSTDRGRTWQQVAKLSQASWSTLFWHRGALYLFGKTKAGSDIVIRRSRDEGRTWTTPRDASRGQLGPSGGTTPNTPVIHGGRLWIATGVRVWSAPVGADLLQASSWTRSGRPPTDKSYLNGRFTFWSEGQVVAAPAQGVFVLPKIWDRPFTALLGFGRPNRRPSFDPAQDFVRLPGAEKKFGVRYDPVSNRFWALTNPVLKRHERDANVPWSVWRFWRKAVTPGLVRNAAAIYSSRDLRSWRFEQVFLYSRDVKHTGFQYLNFSIEGNDLLVVSRTAFKVGRHEPPRAHDSNLLTFHRVRDFRSRPADPYPRGSGLNASNGAP
ncbi:MAG TPA: hypothetical protein DEA08_20150 [Planctomycetes bacterium]|nr:hypothetical protein [Planctomycetota bacterium]